MNSYRATGLILRRVDIGEADRIYVFLRSDGGKINAKAKGIRKAQSKLRGHLEPLNELELMVVKGKNLDILTGVRTIRRFQNIASDLDILKTGWLILEMTEKLTKEPSANTYSLVVEALEALDAAVSPLLAELWFKLRLLNELGYRPDLEENLKSHDEISAPKRYFFNTNRGSLITDSKLSFDTSEIGINHIKLWRLALVFPLQKIASIGGAPEAAKESLPIANEFFDYLFGKRFRSSEI